MRTTLVGCGKTFGSSLLLSAALCAMAIGAQAQAPDNSPSSAQKPPDWAYPGSATHKQVAPPADFHRDTRTVEAPTGIFEGQSDVGGPFIPGSATYDAATKSYTVNSAGYNIWYTRDEFHLLWKKTSGDAFVAADIAFPDPNGYGDRKAVLMIRQTLEDDSKEAFVALHGEGMIQLAQRPETGARIKDVEFRIGGRGLPGGASPDSLVNISAKRIGIQKHGDTFTLFVSLEGEPMHAFGPPISLHMDGPFYVGIGFCSHVPDKSDTAVFSNVVMERAAPAAQ